LTQQIRDRAEGVPLYAVETVRMLLDRGLLTQEGTRYVLTGEVADLEVPETLQALVAARLDGLDHSQRTLLQDAAVIGQSFTPATLTAISGRSAPEVEHVLTTLVDKQVLAYTDDVRSAERGQYSFLQGLVRTVALSTLSRRDRKAKHLAVARYLEQTFGDEAGDIAEVLASHYLDAVEADPEAGDAQAIRASASQTLEDAGRRAISLALGPEARVHFEHAADLSVAPERRGRLLREAANAAFTAGELADALALLERAGAAAAEADLPRELARVESLTGTVLIESGRTEEASDRLARAYAALEGGEDQEAFAVVAASWSRAAFAGGDHERALALAETALPIAEGRRLTSLLISALTTKANIMAEAARPTESTALLRYVVELAVDEELGDEAVRGYYNLAENLMAEARLTEAQELLERGLGFARRRGDSRGERWLLSQGMFNKLLLGHWDEVLEEADRLTARVLDQWAYMATTYTPFVLCNRGELARAESLLPILEARGGLVESDTVASAVRAMVQRERGDAAGALAEAREACLRMLESSISHLPLEFAEAVQTAFAAQRPDVVVELLERVDALKPVQLIPLLDAEAARARARLAALQGSGEEAIQWFRRSIDLFRELGTPFFRARAQLEYAELLGAGTEEAVAPRDEAATTFAALEATPWLDRARALSVETTTA
jgi:tetratricopeptide (TPR) repeat protein